MTSVLVTGLSVVDFVFGVDQVPDRAEKYRAHEFGTVGGGCAANASVAIQRLGGTAKLVSRIGDDDVGRVIRSGLESEGVDCTYLYQFEDARSPLSAVMIDGSGERQIVNFRGDGLSDDPSWVSAIDTDFKAVLTDTRWQKGAAASLRLARLKNVPGVVDAEAPVFPDVAELGSHIAFSEQGLRDFSGNSDRLEGLSAAAVALEAWVCVTCGADGTFYVENGHPVHVPAFEVDTVDTLGAGDIWHGAFTLNLAEGSNEHEAVLFANAAAALKCTRAGGRDATPTRIETDKFLEERLR